MFNCNSVTTVIKLLITVIMMTGTFDIVSAVLPLQQLPKPKSDIRIVGGSKSEITDMPFLISLQFRITGMLQFHMCGGCILNTNTIITACHCVEKVQASQLIIRAGTKNNVIGGQLITVQNIIKHPNYDSRTFDNDIAILRLKNLLQFSATVAAIALPINNARLPIGSIGKVAGWGALNEKDRNIQQYLHAVDIPIYNRGECQKLNGYLTDNMICAGLQQGGKDSCQGDSGGPLFSNNQLIGIVSWGFGCARPDYPGVYTNVAKYVYWIKANL